jgi:hypothetical protein
MKYKPCCGKRCMLGNCKTREDGGCYCLCHLKDHEAMILSLLDGTSKRYGDGIIFNPNVEAIPLEGDEKEKTQEELEKVKLQIKEYEVSNNLDVNSNFKFPNGCHIALDGNIIE